MAVLIDRAALDSATPHGVLGEDGRSGAALERLTLTDGRPVVVKYCDPGSDLVMQMIGDDHGREVELVLTGVLDDLPPSVRHPILNAWYDERGNGVVSMRDLGDAVVDRDRVLGWNKALDIVEHPDEDVRARERAGLDWWLAQAGHAFERGLV